MDVIKYEEIRFILLGVDNMLSGTYSVPRVIEESICRNSEDSEFTDTNDFKIHSTSLMPNIEFELAKQEPTQIDASIFVNDSETKLEIKPTTKVQNYLTCKYVGRANLEFYGNGNKTKMGREFLLICRENNPAYENRVFGTEAAIRGYNKDANDNFTKPKYEAPSDQGNIF